MKNLIEKAAVLVEVMPYIQRFRDETVVVKFGGSIMEDRKGVQLILRDIAFMQCAGLRPVIVHGGGKSISQKMKDAGLRAQFVKGLRVTDATAVRIVEDTLNNEVNPEMVAGLESYGCKARGIHGEDIVRAAKHTRTDPDTGEVLDWGFVGEVVDVDIEHIQAFLNAGITPVITPLGKDADGQIYNINADDVAAAVARCLRARKLVFLSDVPGLLENPSDANSIMSTLRVSDVDGLIKRGVIDGGMLPKIQGAVKALQAGVRKTHLIDSGLPHSLLLELFTDEGVGTEIIQ